MRLQPILCAFLPTLALASVPCAAGVAVTFPDSDKYTDAGDRFRDSSDAVGVIERHLQALGSRYLAPQQNLKIEVLDIDLAGELRMIGQYGTMVRVLKGKADWPRIQLRYALEAAGKPAKTGEEMISDPSYMMHGRFPNSGDTFSHEKRMLDTWFKSRFAEGVTLR